MTMSNEHPDMSGNWADMPFCCAHCGREVKEEKAYGIPARMGSNDDELLFCSNDCCEEFLDARRPE